MKNKYKKELVNILQRLEKEEKIRNEDKKFLYPTTENIPRMYGSPKIHKDGTPLRPIVDFTGSIGYNVAKSLADILAPIVGQSEHHVLNSKSLANQLKDITIEEDEILNSHDVVALFTNTPIDLTLQIIRDRLELDQDLKNRTLLSIDDIIELIELTSRESLISATTVPSTAKSSAWLWVVHWALLFVISSWSGLRTRLLPPPPSHVVLVFGEDMWMMFLR